MREAARSSLPISGRSSSGRMAASDALIWMVIVGLGIGVVRHLPPFPPVQQGAGLLLPPPLHGGTSAKFGEVAWIVIRNDRSVGIMFVVPEGKPPCRSAGMNACGRPFSVLFPKEWNSGRIALFAQEACPLDAPGP